MKPWLWVMIACGVTALAAPSLRAQVRSPFQLLDEPMNVYLPQETPTPEQLTNQGGVHFSLDVSYLSHYIYRGVDQTTPPLRTEKSLQFNSRLDFDLGKLPHPFLGVFANVFNNDPISKFEEVRPYFGVDWTIRPITIGGGYTSYIFPNRENRDTQEVWMSLGVDDAGVFHTAHPFISPYIVGAYDYDKYDGFYIEGGIHHDFEIPKTGLILTGIADVAYVAHNKYFLGTRTHPKDTGFQHYDVGLEATYDLKYVLGIPRRYGIWELKGYLYYTSSIQSRLRADIRIWGGVGISFKY
jgi:hypothetical protein